MPGRELIGIEEQKQISEIFDSGSILFRHGFDNERGECYKVQEFEINFANYIGSNYSLALTSGTAALRVALAALSIGSGDEVIIPAFTFVATAEAVVESGAIPKCANINESLNIDPEGIEELITSRTKALIVVHMLGVPCELTKLKEICQKNNIFLIEDTAWGCGGSYKNKKLGTWGDVGAFSFDFAKTITTGEGGMAIFQDKKVFHKAAAWHDHGHENNPNFARWEDTRSGSGFNFRMMELQGALGIAQLQKLDFVVQKQRENSEYIWASICDIEGIQRRAEPKDSISTADALIFSVATSDIALNVRQELLNNGISTKILPEAISWHFAGLWDHIPSLVNSSNGKLRESLNYSEKLLSKCISLPISINFNKSDLPKIKKSILKGLNK